LLTSQLTNKKPLASANAKNKMKTIETKPFSYSELSPEAKANVIKRESERILNDPVDFTLSDCMDSLKAIASALGLRLTNWSIGPYNRGNYCAVNSDEDGNKAIARFVRCLVNHGYSRPKHFKDMQFPGNCGFTGVCFDEDVAETILGALLDGENMSKAFDRAADKIARICEDDLEWRASEKGILEYLDQTEEIYTEDGEIF
jgi:hypothetical protein